MTTPNAGGVFKNKQTTLIVGGGAAVAVMYFVLKRRSNAAAAAANAAANTAASDPNAAGYDPNAVSGYSAAVGTTPSLYGYTDPSTGATISGYGSTVISAPSTNAQWFQQTEAYLINQGYDPLTTSTALGKYLVGAGLTDTELGIVQAAIGAEGYPPQTPPPPHAAANSGQGGGTTGGSALPAPAIWEAGAHSGAAQLQWNPVEHATGYWVYLGNFLYTTTTQHAVTVHRNGTYHIIAKGDGTNYRDSASSNQVTVRGI